MEMVLAGAVMEMVLAGVVATGTPHTLADQPVA